MRKRLQADDQCPRCDDGKGRIISVQAIETASTFMRPKTPPLQMAVEYRCNRGHKWREAVPPSPPGAA